MNVVSAAGVSTAAKIVSNATKSSSTQYKSELKPDPITGKMRPATVVYSSTGQYLGAKFTDKPAPKIPTPPKGAHTYIVTTSSGQKVERTSWSEDGETRVIDKPIGQPVYEVMTPSGGISVPAGGLKTLAGQTTITGIKLAGSTQPFQEIVTPTSDVFGSKILATATDKATKIVTANAQDKKYRKVFESLTPSEKAIMAFASPISTITFGATSLGAGIGVGLQRALIEAGIYPEQKTYSIPILGPTTFWKRSTITPGESMRRIGSEYVKQKVKMYAEHPYLSTATNVLEWGSLGLAGATSLYPQAFTSLSRVTSRLPVWAGPAFRMGLGGTLIGYPTYTTFISRDERGKTMWERAITGDVESQLGVGTSVAMGAFGAMELSRVSPIKYGSFKGQIPKGKELKDVRAYAGLYFRNPFDPYARAIPLIGWTREGIELGVPPASAFALEKIQLPLETEPISPLETAIVHRPEVYVAQGFTLPEFEYMKANRAMGNVVLVIKGQRTPSLEGFETGTQHLSKQQLDAMVKVLVKDPQFINAYGSKISTEQARQLLRSYIGQGGVPIMREPGDLDTMFNRFGSSQENTIRKLVDAANSVDDIKSFVIASPNDEGKLAKIIVASGPTSGAKVFEAHYYSELTDQIAKTPYGYPSSLSKTRIGKMTTSSLQEQYTNKLLDASLKRQVLTRKELNELGKITETFVTPSGQVVTKKVFDVNAFKKVYGDLPEYKLLMPTVTQRGVKDILDLPYLEKANTVLKFAEARQILDYSQMFPGVVFPEQPVPTSQLIAVGSRVAIPATLPSVLASASLLPSLQIPSVTYPKIDSKLTQGIQSFMSPVSSVPSQYYPYYPSPSPYSPYSPYYPSPSPPTPPSPQPEYYYYSYSSSPSSPPSSPIPSESPSPSPSPTPPIPTIVPGPIRMPIGGGYREPVGMGKVGPNIYYNELALVRNILRGL